MHHISPRTPCIAPFNCGHLLHIQIYHVEPKSEIQGSKSVSCGGPQAISYVDTNLALDQGKPRCITPNL
jgi:hypothetical protein